MYCNYMYPGRMKIDGGVRWGGVGEVKRQHTTQKAFPPPLPPNTPLRQPASAHMAASGLRCTRTMGCVTGCFSPVCSARCAHLFERTTANHSPGSEKYACAANNTPPRDPFQPLFFLTPLLSFVHSSTSHLPPTTTASHIPRSEPVSIAFIIRSFR